MDQTGLVLASVGVTATTVGAFWLRTESIREEIKRWVDEKYMTREATNLKFDAITVMLNDQNKRMDSLGQKIDVMEGRQRVQIGLLRSINERVGGKPPEGHGNAIDET